MRHTNARLASAAVLASVLACLQVALLAQSPAEAGGPRPDRGNEAKSRAPRRPDVGQPGEGPGQAFALDPQDAEWTMLLNASAQVEILHWGAPVVRSRYVFQGVGGKPADAKVGVAERSGRRVDLAGTVDALGLKL